MSEITYQSFNNLLCEFVSELSQSFDEYPDLSKAHDALLAQLVVEGKTEVERLREQIQNVE